VEHTDVLAHIAASDSTEQLAAIRIACDQRAKQIRDARWQAKVDEAWERYRNLKPGVVVWCHRQGLEIGGSGFQRGDKATVHSLQPRARRVWLKLRGGKLWWWGEHAAVHLDLRTVPPEKPASEAEKQLAERLGGALND
jgi:hypothetical protein